MDRSARHVVHSRSTPVAGRKSASNENFRDQLAAADIIVANKSDRATPESEQALERWWQQNGGDRQLIHSEHGKLTVIFWICRVAI